MVRKINVPALGQDVLDLIGEGGGGGGGGGSTIYVPVTYQLSGPDADGVLSGTAPGSFGFVGSALSASSKRIAFQYGTMRCEFARFQVVWTSGSLSNEVELVHADDGPTNITQIDSLFPASAGSPVNSSVDVTAGIDALCVAEVSKNLLWRIQGGATYTIFEVRLEVVWRYEINGGA